MNHKCFDFRLTPTTSANLLHLQVDLRVHDCTTLTIVVCVFSLYTVPRLHFCSSTHGTFIAHSPSSLPPGAVWVCVHVAGCRCVVLLHWHAPPGLGAGRHCGPEGPPMCTHDWSRSPRGSAPSNRHTLRASCSLSAPAVRRERRRGLRVGAQAFLISFIPSRLEFSLNLSVSIIKAYTFTFCKTNTYHVKWNRNQQRRMFARRINFVIPLHISS